MSRIITRIRAAAAGYEPALASSILAAGLTLAAGLGLVVGDFPEKANAILTFIAFLAPIVAGAYTRSKVIPVKTLEAGSSLPSAN